MADISPRSMQSVDAVMSPPRAKSTHSVSFSSGKPTVCIDGETSSVASSAILPSPPPPELDTPLSKPQGLDHMLPPAVTQQQPQHQHHQQTNLSLNDLTELSDYEEEDEASMAESSSIALPTAKHFSSFLPDGFNFDSEETHNPLTQLICSQSKKRVPNWDEVLLYMQANPSQCKRLHGWDEELPLHWALREKAPLHVIEPLLRIFPEGSSCRGRHGAIPLWYALGTPREAEDMHTIVAMLLEAHPHGVRLRVDKLLPIHMAVKLNVSEKIIFLLLNLDLPCADDGFPIAYHTFSWAWLIEQTADKYLNVVKDTLAAHPSIAQELAKAQTERGTLALQVGHNDMRQIVFNEAFFCGRYEISTAHPIHKSNSVVVVHAIDHRADQSYAQAFDDQLAANNNANEGDEEGTDVEKLEMDETRFVAALQRVGGYVDSDAQDLSRIFGSNDAVGKSTSISKNEFVRFCKNLFDSPREVVIKFMTSEVSFLREYNSRSSCNLDCRYVVHILNALSGSELEEAVSKVQLAEVKSMDAFKFATVMPVSERNLESICIHEDLDQIHTCKIMKDLALALQHLHARGICHGDVRMRNVIRIAKRYCLLDLTASANLEIFYVQDADLFGSKFRTAMLPPEMFVKLSPHGENCIGKYWANSRNFEEQWPHVKPVRTHLGTYSVRSYDVDLKTKRPRDLHLLPYSPLSASTSIDMWGFGLLLYNLCCGEPLLYASRNDDIINPLDYAAAALWTEASLQKKIDASVLDPIAADLIMQLLQPSPEDRPSSMKQVLEHVYFSALDDGARKSINGQKMEEIFTAHAQRTHEDVSNFSASEAPSPMPGKKKRLSTPIKEINGPVYDITSRSVLAEVKRSHQILRRFLFESGDTIIPTCFIIVNQKLFSSGKGKEDFNKKVINSVDSQSEDSEDSEEKTQLVPQGHNPAFFRMNQSHTARRWYQYFYNIASAQRNNARSCVEEVAGEIRKMCMEEELYLYFMDEVTMKIIQPDKSAKKLDGVVYPIRITNADEFIPKIFPLMKVSLHAIAAFRDMEVMCRSFGFPADCLEDVDIHCVNSLGDVSAASAEKDFENMTKIIEDSGLLSTVAAASTPKKQTASDSASNTAPSPRGGGSRDASLYKILASRVSTEDNFNFNGIKGSSLKELGIFLAAHDVASGYGSLKKVQIKDNVVTYTSKANMDKFMKNVADEKSDDKKKSNQNRRVSNDSVQAAPTMALSAGSSTVDDVNDSVLELREDVQRLQRVLERMNKRDEQRAAREEEPLCGCGCSPCPTGGCCAPGGCCSIS